MTAEMSAKTTIDGALQTTMTGDTSVRFTKHYAAAPETVFRAWTEPDLLARWCGPEGFEVCSVEFDARLGGKYRLQMTETSWVTGTVVELTRPTRLAYTWQYVEVDANGREAATAESLVTISLRDQNGGTALTLVHENLSGTPGRDGVAHGWTGSFAKLERFLAAQGD